MRLTNFSKRTITILLSASIFICCSDKPATGQTNSSDQKETTTPQGKPNLGVPIPELKFADDVKKYIRDILAAPLPADYVLPADMLAAKSYDECVSMVNIHYPQFTNLESDALLRAVKENPMVYQEMMLEARSVRERYFPGSQPKRTN